MVIEGSERTPANQRKLVIHQGASYVIARKGQGFVDKYIKPKKKKNA